MGALLYNTGKWIQSGRSEYSKTLEETVPDSIARHGYSNRKISVELRKRPSEDPGLDGIGFIFKVWEGDQVYSATGAPGTGDLKLSLHYGPDDRKGKPMMPEELQWLCDLFSAEVGNIDDVAYRTDHFFDDVLNVLKPGHLVNRKYAREKGMTKDLKEVLYMSLDAMKKSATVAVA